LVAKNRNKDDENSESEDRPRLPPIQRWSDMMDGIIGEAISEGLFDNLPGEGKPLNLTTNPFSPETELAHQLLKANDFTLPWITERAALQKAVDDLRDSVSQQWTMYKDEFLAAESKTIRMSLNLGWTRQIERWSQKIRDLNDQIAEANLKQPAKQLEILKLSLDSELERIGASRELG
jgi:DnaJ family protein C protein 28